MVLFGKHVEAGRGVTLEEIEPRQTIRTETINAHKSRNGHDHACVLALNECRAACLDMVGHSIRMQGYYAELGHVRLLEDCARLCESTVDFLLRGSELAPEMLALCGEVCRRSARDCERFDYDQQLLDCAAACNRCAESCDSRSA